MPRVLAAAVLACGLGAGATEVELPERRAVVTAAFEATALAELESLGIVVGVLPRPVELVTPDGLRARALRRQALVLVPPFSRAQLTALKRYAGHPGCRLVVHAEGALAPGDLASLSQIGPCFLELHAGASLLVFEDRIRRFAPASMVWEAGTGLPDPHQLARLARLPRPLLAVSVERAVAALSVLALFEGDVGLVIRAPFGVLPAEVERALRAPGRRPRVVVLAEGGLDPFAARRLRTLPRACVELALERLRQPLPALLAAARALSRTVDPADERRPPEAEADALLLQPPPL